MRGVLIDVPMIAHKTWAVSYLNKTKNDEEDFIDKSLDDIKKLYPYKENNKHIR